MKQLAADLVYVFEQIDEYKERNGPSGVFCQRDSPRRISPMTNGQPKPGQPNPGQGQPPQQPPKPQPGQPGR
jgi:hypothetical protein